MILEAVKNDKYYVYGHFKQDTGEIFYIGKGSKNRLNSKQRSNYWERIVNKHGFFAKKIASNLTEKEAFNFEVLLIKKLRKSGVILCNLTDGGEGAAGKPHTEEHKKYISSLMVGKKHAKGCKRTEEFKKEKSKFLKEQRSKNKINGFIIGLVRKFTDEQVREIRNTGNTPQDRKRLALQFNVSVITINSIYKRKYYKYVS